MNSEMRHNAPDLDPEAVVEEVQARTQALWPQAASAANLAEEGAVFRRLRSNRLLEHRRCVLEVKTVEGKRFVLRADFDTGKPQSIIRELERQQKAAQSLKPVPGVSAPELLWQDPQHPYALMEFAQGDTAYRTLALTDYGIGAREEVLRRIGEAVAALHRVSDTGVRQFWPKPFLEMVSDRALAVREGRLGLPNHNRFLGLCAYLHRAARVARGSEFRSALAHGDLHLRNIIMSDQNVSFIDFLNHKAIFPQRDIADIWLANCPEHLASDGNRPGFGLVAQADWAAFEEGYGSGLTEGTGLTDNPVFRFIFAWRLFRFWVSPGRKLPELQRNSPTAVSVVRVLDALLADETE